MMDKDETERIEQHFVALLGNVDGYLDRKLKLGAFYILAAEELRQMVVGKAQSFYQLDFENPPSDRAPKGLFSRRSAQQLKSAVDWFCNLDAFSDADKSLVQLTMEMRNNAAHEMSSMLWDHGSDPFSEDTVQTMLSLATKINKWWVVNFEAEIDPEGFGAMPPEALENANTVSTATLISLFFAAFPEMKTTEVDKEL